MCAHWHGLAKLRMHSDLTLEIMDEVTTSLGKAFRQFQNNVCPTYNSKELPREANARRRRHQNADANGKINSTRDEPLQKKFNLQTYKHHSLGDYVNTIRQFGTTDSYSTTTVGIIQTSYNLSTHRARRVNSSIAARKHGIFERIARTL